MVLTLLTGILATCVAVISNSKHTFPFLSLTIPEINVVVTRAVDCANHYGNQTKG